MTEDEIVSIINNVANRLASRFKFGYHELEDMRQQARLFAWEAMKNYDGIRPLENFLWTHVRNRLFNFKRDKYTRPGKPCTNCKDYIYDNIDGDSCKTFIVPTNCDNYNNWLTRNTCKKNLMNPIGIDNIDDNNENRMKINANFDSLDYKDMLSIIDKELPLSLRPLFLRLKFNNKLTKVQKTKIQHIIREILTKYGYRA